PNLPPRALFERHFDLQYAVPHLSLGFLGFGAVGKRDGAVEAAGAALDQAIALLVAAFLALLLALAGDRQADIAHIDADVFLADSREVGAHDEHVAALADVDLRFPQRGNLS